jgi:hypothetical protein
MGLVLKPAGLAGWREALAELQWRVGELFEGFKGRVAAYIERIQFRREAPWTRSARTARVSI